MATDRRQQYRRFLMYVACFHVVCMAVFLGVVVILGGAETEWYYFWLPSAFSVGTYAFARLWVALITGSPYYEGRASVERWGRLVVVRFFLFMPPVMAMLGLWFELIKSSRLE